MQGLILAAGRGSRLGDFDGGTPKCLLNVGDHPLIDHQLTAFSAAGIGPVTLVVGYAADAVQAAVGSRANYVHNSRWSATNSMYSFWLARHAITGPVVVLNCDTLFHPEILRRLLVSGPDALVFDSSSGDSDEHMKVQIEDDCLCDMSKELPAECTAGENVGMLYFSAETARAVFAMAETLIATHGEKSWLSAAVREVAKTRPIRTVDIVGLPWVEIDFPNDLEHARQTVWPAIEPFVPTPALAPAASTSMAGTDSARIARRAYRPDTAANDRPAARRVRFGSRTAMMTAAMLLVIASVALAVVWELGRLNGRSSNDVETLVAVDVGWPFEGATRATCRDVTVAAPTRSETWAQVPNGRYVEFHVVGPCTVKLQSRLMLPLMMDSNLPNPAQYGLGIAVDRHRLDWRQLIGTPSQMWRVEHWPVTKSREVLVKIPAGTRVVRVVFRGPAEFKRCLVRIDVLSEASDN